MYITNINKNPNFLVGGCVKIGAASRKLKGRQNIPNN